MSLPFTCSAMTSQWFIYYVIDIHRALYAIGSIIKVRALYIFLHFIYALAFYPENYIYTDSSGLWENTFLPSHGMNGTENYFGATVRLSRYEWYGIFLCILSKVVPKCTKIISVLPCDCLVHLVSNFKQMHKTISKVSLITTVFVLAGLISFVVEDLNLLPNSHTLSPLLGGMVVRYSWRDILISQCWKRKRKRIRRMATSNDIFAHLCRVQKYNGIVDHPTTYSDERLSSFVASLDILEMNSLLEMFNNHQSPIQTGLHAEVDRLNALTRSYSQLDPVLSPLDTLLYNSVIPQVVMESTYLTKDEASMPIVIDTGASRSISPHKSDFIEFRTHHMEIGTINASSQVEGEGIVRWKVTDQNGISSIIETAAYYIPGASIRLYSPQYHFREHCGGSLRMDNVGLHLTLPNHRAKPALSFPFNAVNNLPMMLPSHHPHFTSAMFSSCPSGDEIHSAVNKLSPILKDVPVVEHFDLLTTRDSMEQLLLNGDQRANLSSAQLELRMIHNKMGHVHMKRLQKLVHHEKPLDSRQSEGELNPPVVFRSRFAKTKSCTMPLCRSCALSKMTKQKTNTQHHTNDPAKEMALQREHLAPGACISWDQYVVPHRGRLYTSAGRERESLRYGGGSLAVDHASKRVFIHHQVSLDARHTLIGKRLLERDAREVGVTIQRYHADNGIFASAEFKADCELKEQKLTFSASNSHHQNGVAERYIGTISRMARAMLIHQALLWPRRHNVNLWPMAMDYAVWLWNNLPMDDGLSPEEKWTRTKVANYDHLRRAHVFGCPCYVLNPKLVEGQKIPKWDPRSRQGKFVGYSKEHASNAGLILNCTTGFMSPQYHVLYDDSFESVPGCDEDQNRNLMQVDWHSLIERQGGSEISYELGDIDEVPNELHDSWLTEREINEKRQRELLRNQGRNHGQVNPHNAPILRNDPNIIVVNPGPRAQPVNPPQVQNPGADNQAAAGNNQGQVNPLPRADIDQARQNAQVQVRRSTRNRRPNEPMNIDRLGGPRNRAFVTHDEVEAYQKQGASNGDMQNHFAQSLNWSDSVAALASKSRDSNGDASRFFAQMDALQNPEDLSMDDFPELAFATKSSQNDNPRFDEAMNGPNSEGFWEAAAKEAATLQNIGTWEQVERKPDMNVIQSTWAFKIKRFPDGLVRKLKSRLCVRGDQQIEGVDFFDTFAPVVQWSTVRMMFILSLQLGLASTQVDYVSAFCQAPIEEEVYVALPRGWETLNTMNIPEKFKRNHVLKLKRSMYGLRQSPRNFFKHLKKNLEIAGFVQSENDPCLFISDNVICVCYVDDCLWWSPEQRHIDEAIERVKVNMDLEVEDSVDGFLGISVDRKLGDDGEEEIHLTQKGLIDRVITALGLDKENSNGVRTPAPDAPLPQDKDGEPHDLGFNYASVVGMAMYLCNNSRPEIAFAVHQCARHSFNPTRKHAEYLKRIGRYLISTRDKGLIIKRDLDRSILDIECFVDADFAGMFSHEDKNDPHCVRSRTGYVIMMGGSPIVWKSNLQPIIASSTMESEYIAMSTACKDLIPLRRTAKEIAKACGVSREERVSMRTTIWEDNVGALTLANLELPQMTPRSKAIGVRYHWFRQFVSQNQGEDGGIVIKKVDTKNQIADIFTKGLSRELFERLRKMLTGW